MLPKIDFKEVIRRVIESDDNSSTWAIITAQLHDSDLPQLVKLKAATVQAIDQILERGKIPR
jgi:hypothetical protein